MRRYTAGDFTRYLNVTPGQSTTWQKFGIIKPLDGGGKGRAFSYPLNEMVCGCLAEELSALQVPQQVTAELTDFLRGASSLDAFLAKAPPHDGGTEQERADLLAWAGFVHGSDAARAETGIVSAVLIWSPGQRPRIAIAQEGRSTWPDLRNGGAVIVPLLSILRRLERATGDRWPSDEELRHVVTNAVPAESLA